MNPRLKTSKKFTAFPQEFEEQIHAVFKENFKKQLQNADLIVQGRIYPQEILLRVGFIRANELKQANFEVSADYDTKKKNAVDSIHLCVDFLASTLDQYFEQGSKASDDEEGLDLPYTWKAVSFEKHQLFFQFSTVNTKLEAEADRLLGENGDESLVRDEEDPDFEAEDLEGDEDEGDDDPSKRTLH